MNPKLSKDGERRVRLMPQDPFDLIRLLANSQSDPRKAVAELVQNSLDAGAKRVEIDWFNEKGQRALRIWDDGSGIFPELDREQALERIARTIGHSYKRDMSPSERREQMVLGRFGIGLIGFWSIGEVMLVRSRVGGGRAYELSLIEDSPTAQVAPCRARRIEDEATFTEITITGVHTSSALKIRPPRLQAFLASELRGQLLDRDATIQIHDRVARGRARKVYRVKARPYLGAPLADWTALAVDGFEDARIELYLINPDEDRRGSVTLSCGGTTVLEDLSLIDGNDAPRAPWSSGRFEGDIDFPDFSVAPSTRRGLVHNEPLDAFMAALPKLEAELSARLALEYERRANEHHENLAKDIRRAFRSVAQRLPEYELFEVAGRSKGSRGTELSERAQSEAVDDQMDEAVGGAGQVQGPESSEATEGVALHTDFQTEGHDSEADQALDDSRDPSDVERESDNAELEHLLFPPGPLASIAVEPQRLRVPWRASRNLRARAVDLDGRPCSGAVEWTWELLGIGELSFEGKVARYQAPPEPFDLGVSYRPEDARVHTGDGPEELEAAARHRTATIRVTATQSQHGAELCAASEVRVSFITPTQPDRTTGIPEPIAVHAPSERWRSRLRNERWEYNDAHPDYLTAAASETARLRYLVLLFAKEVIVRNFGNPADAELLERMVEILTCLDADKRR